MTAVGDDHVTTTGGDGDGVFSWARQIIVPFMLATANVFQLAKKYQVVVFHMSSSSYFTSTSSFFQWSEEQKSFAVWLSSLQFAAAV